MNVGGIRHLVLGLAVAGLTARTAVAMQQRPADAPVAPDVVLRGIEITQGIQSSKNDVVLIAGRATWARVFLTGTAPFEARGWARLTDLTTGRDTLIQSKGTVGVERGGTADLYRLRSDTGLLFPIPKPFARGDSLRVELVRVESVPAGLPSDCQGCSSNPTIIAFHPTPPLRVRAVGLRYSAGNPARTYEPRVTDFAHLKSWLRRAYPTVDLEFSDTIIDLDPALLQPWDTMSEVNCIGTHTRHLRELKRIEGLHPLAHYYGMVSNGYYFMRGCATGGGFADGNALAAGPSGPEPGGRRVPHNSAGWDTDSSWADWYGGHELGHAFGRGHVRYREKKQRYDGFDESYPFEKAVIGDPRVPGKDYIGFDRGDPKLGIDMAVRPGHEWRDVLSYAPRLWLSAYNYDSIRHRLIDEKEFLDSIQGARFLSLHPQIPGPFTWVAARVNLTDVSGSIDRVGREDTAPVEIAPPDPRVAVRLIGPANEILGSYPVAVREVVRAPGDSTEMGIVGAAVPLHANAVRLELVVRDRVVDAVDMARGSIGLAPVDSFGVPLAAGEPQRQPPTLQWRVESGDASRVSYSVWISDDATRWEIVDFGTVRDAVVLDRSRLGSRDRVWVRVIVSDGIHLTEWSELLQLRQ